jgi:hypothetical protein
MKRIAALADAIKRRRNPIKNLITKKSELLLAKPCLRNFGSLLLSAFLVGGFFYSLAYITVFKTSLSQLHPKHEPLASFAQMNKDNHPIPEAKAAETKPAGDTLSNMVMFPAIGISQFSLLEKKLQKEDLLQKNQTSLLPEKNTAPTTSTDLLAAINQSIKEDQTPKISAEEEAMKEKISSIVKGTPMHAMAEAISKQEKTVAAFLVGIALKESQLGRHAPYKNGKSCFNYWGIKGNINPTAGGYNCFASPEQAVEVTGKRIEKLVNKNLNTPNKLVTTWKCGSSCKGHSPESVAGWVKDVSRYFYQINNS